MIIKSQNQKYEYEFCQIAKQFLPYENFENASPSGLVCLHTFSCDEQSTTQKIVIAKLQELEKRNIIEKPKCQNNLQNENNIQDEINVEISKKIQKNSKNIFIFEKKYDFSLLKLEKEKNLSRLSKKAIYEAFSKMLKTKLDWGCLSGVRPTKIAYELLSQNHDLEIVKDKLVEVYDVKENKAQLLCDILKTQNKKTELDKDQKHKAIFYVNIPFCTSKCSYCSFVSAVVSKCQTLVQPYVDALIYEIKQTKKFIKKNKIQILSCYMGGGTPTALSAEQLDTILSECNFGKVEWTVEAGRPDTITKEKLDVLKKHNITRISINPQTFNDKVLKTIGRNHTSNETMEKYNLARTYDFDINMDLIAGLPNESYKSFCNTIKTTLALKPENITIHTLALKTKAQLIKDKKFERKSKKVKKMIDFSRKKLEKNNYFPYYLYRQKNMLENQENVGWTKQGKNCSFNIDSMEDFVDVIACGANSVSKRIFPSCNRIERCDCPKDIKTYIEKIDNLCARKEEFFD